ncbi:MAG: metallophosphoesterase [Vibrio splendidus]
MKKVDFGLVSDTHLHNWGAFSSDKDGLNGRLVIILNEILRAAKVIKERGGKYLYHTGDLFHVRGSISPSVLYPTIDLFKEISEMGIESRLLAGNHDLESNDSEAINNGIEALRTIDGVKVVSKTTIFEDEKVVMVPWFNRAKDLLDEIQRIVDELDGAHTGYNLMIHAPVDNVIAGIPSHGITAEALEEFGFNRVYSGHYHNHKELTSKVVSVGATTHQTWGDIDSVAGFILVNEDDDIEHYRTEAPEFRDYDTAVITSEEEAMEFCNGHYVRVKIGTATQSQIEKMKSWLLDDCNAAGVLVQAQPKGKVAEREEGATIETGKSIQLSIKDWLAKQTLAVKQEDIEIQCDVILREVDDRH